MSSVARHVSLTLSLSMLLFGCSQAPTPGSAADNPYAGGKSYPWSSRLDAPGADPYAGGKSYPWRSPTTSATLGAQGLGEGATRLSDTTWTSATSNWGPIELDRSNGEQPVGDGRPLTIGGVTYDKGLGVHANSEVRYALNGQCTTFFTGYGIDDEVGDRGSVVFQVYGDGVKLFDSGVVTGRDAPRSTEVPMSGVRELRLVVTNGGDNIDYDHADWAGAGLLCEARAPSGPAYLSDVVYRSARSDWGPVELDGSNGEQVSNDGRPLSIGGQRFAKGLGVHASSDITYPLGGNCTRFTAQVGVDDEVGDRGSVVFQVYGDDTKLYDSGVVTGRDPARPVDVDLSGRQALRLVVTNGEDNIDYDHADWADARLDCAGAPPGLDVTFGTRGVITTYVGSVVAGATVGVFDAQGRLVVGGSGGDAAKNSNYAFKVARYSAGGTLDTSFGQGGIATTQFSPVAPSTTEPDDYARDMLIDPQGRILVVGTAREGLYGASQEFQASDFALARYNPDGTPDTSFGQGGVVKTDLRGYRDEINAVTLDAQGRILVAGFAGLGNGTDRPYTQDLALARYNSNGTLDSSFGSGGKVITKFDVGTSSALKLLTDAQGRTTVIGKAFVNNPGPYPLNRLLVARYTPNGTPDTSFGSGGQTTSPFGGVIATAAVDGQGRIVAVGDNTAGASSTSPDFLVARYTVGGTPDTTFGVGGQVTTDFGGRSDSASGVVIDASGRITVVGSSSTSASTDNFAVARYTPNGTLDTTFGQGGQRRFSLSATNVILDPQQRPIVLGGTQESGGRGSFLLARLLP